MNFILAVLLILFIILFGLIPFFMIYPMCNFIAVILYRIIGYRKQVIRDNLLRSCKGRSEKEIDELVRKAYRNLTDIIVEGIKSFTMTRRQVLKRHKIVNPEVLAPFIKSKQSLIGVTAHYNNWEWGSLSGSLQIDMNVVAFYKPLSNPYVDRFLRWSRSRFGTKLASIYETTATFKKYANEPTIYLMAADQNPSNPDKAFWVDFLGRDTAFLHGPEKHALQNKLPLIFIAINRERRGYYKLTLSELVHDPVGYTAGEITRLYAKKVEEEIRDDPPNWLWSHKRWKHQHMINN